MIFYNVYGLLSSSSIKMSVYKCLLHHLTTVTCHALYIGCHLNVII